MYNPGDFIIHWGGDKTSYMDWEKRINYDEKIWNERVS